MPRVAEGYGKIGRVNSTRRRGDAETGAEKTGEGRAFWIRWRFVTADSTWGFERGETRERGDGGKGLSFRRELYAASVVAEGYGKIGRVNSTRRRGGAETGAEKTRGGQGVLDSMEVRGLGFDVGL